MRKSRSRTQARFHAHQCSRAMLLTRLAPPEAHPSVSEPNREHTQTARAQQPPPVLLLHLKRFQPDARGSWCKMDSHVAFDMCLDVRCVALGQHAACSGVAFDMCLDVRCVALGQHAACSGVAFDMCLDVRCVALGQHAACSGVGRQRRAVQRAVAVCCSCAEGATV